MKQYTDIFLDIYNTNFWRDQESRSGTGSSLVKTRKLSEHLPELFKKFEIKSILDLPCGDYNWMKVVDLSGIDYIGGDLVPEIIKDNRIKYPEVNFIELDLIDGELPFVDLVLIRDCLVHFPNKLVFKSLYNLCLSDCKYVLMTTFPDHVNTIDIEMGKWRPLNLEADPFNLPKPLYIINEGLVGDAYDKSMALWNIDDIKNCLIK
jgi:SAM-dependent methyltransferase